MNKKQRSPLVGRGIVGGFGFERCCRRRLGGLLLAEGGVEGGEACARHGEHDALDNAGVRLDPGFEQAARLLGLEALRAGAERANHERLASVRGRDAQKRLDAVGERVLAFAFGAMVLERASAVGLGDGDHVGAADGTVAHEHHVGQVERAVGEQHARRKAAVLLMVGGLAAEEHGVEVALRAEDLFGAETPVLVRAARARERTRVDDADLALGGKHRLRREVGGHRGSRLASAFGDGELAPVSVLVDHGRLDGRFRLVCERPAHQREVLRGGVAPLVTCGHAASFPGICERRPW